jgi:segregation and condensation protein B
MDAPKNPEPEDSSGALSQGLSLEALTAGFAEMLASGEDPYAPAENPAETITSPDSVARATEPGPEITPRSIVEAMLFVGHPQNEPLGSQQMAALMRGVRAAEVDELVQDLNEQYERNACPYTIRSYAGGYRLEICEKYAVVRERLAGKVREARLSQAAIEVLALVAYNESMTSEEISATRGRTSGAILAQLVRRQLLKIERPAGTPRRACYSTTGRFLQLFGLKSLADLPRSQETDEQ